jgi:hypothetical protein
LIPLVVALVVGLSAPAHGQGAEPTGTIEATISTQTTIRLAGALVELRDGSGLTLDRQVSDPQGLVRFMNVPGGEYRLVASLDGFQATGAAAAVAAGALTTAAIDLPIAVAPVSVEVVAKPVAVETIGKADGISGDTVDEYGGVGGLPAALRLLAGVIAAPGGASIKGGRPAQASTQVGSSMLVDPSTGFVRFMFPADAIDSVAVLPNPYAVEYGRFSSGIVVIQTRKPATDRWNTRVGDLDPSMHTKRHEPFNVTGLESVSPWAETGGPVVENRLFVEQSVQYTYSTYDVPSRPENERRVTNSLSTYTRLDANLATGQSLAGTIGFSPGKRVNETLGTFTPPEAAADLSNRSGNGGLTFRSVWSNSLVSESALQFQKFVTDVTPHGPAPTVLYPETTLGDFFNVQHRDMSTIQWIQTVAGTRSAWGGSHSFKAGVDLFHTAYNGSSVSQSVLIMRSGAPLARRIDFIGSPFQSVQSTDVALFAQDRVQLGSRWLLEFGGRLDRDGIINHVNVTPRVGTAVQLDNAGTTTLRGGYGLFYERVPSVAGAFPQFEREVDTRYAVDGVTPIGSPVTFTPRVVLGPSAPRSATWDLSFERRLNAIWSITASYLNREGSSELVVQPLMTDGLGELRLDSSGHSSYRDLQIGVQYKTPAADFTASYVRSRARADLNSLTNFFDVVMRPVIGANAYAPADTDVPHRLFGRGRYQPTKEWLITGVADWRTGFPYSVVDAYLDFVGPRNLAYRFPNRFMADIGIERHLTGLRAKPWVGIRAYNAFNSFVPSDVQANISSPSFGSFYNSPLRQIRLQIRIAR